MGYDSVITVKLTQEQHEAVRDSAQQQGKNESDIVRELIGLISTSRELLTKRIEYYKYRMEMSQIELDNLDKKEAARDDIMNTEKESKEESDRRDYIITEHRKEVWKQIVEKFGAPVKITNEESREFTTNSIISFTMKLIEDIPEEYRDKVKKDIFFSVFRSVFCLNKKGIAEKMRELGL